MSIIKILYKTAILFTCSIVIVFGVLIEGLSKIFGKLSEYLDDLIIKLLELVESVEKKKKSEKTTSIDIPL